MAKMKFGLDDLDVDEIDAVESTAGYDGDRPPKGVYRCITKKMQIMLNKNGDAMLFTIAEISEPKGSPKAQYNGYTFYDYQNITKQSAPYVLGQLKVLVGENDARSFLREGPNLDGAAPTEKGRANAVPIKTIGKHKLLDAEGNHKPIAFRANTKLGAKSEQYDQRLEISGWLPAGAPVKDDDDADEAPVTSASSAPPPLDDEDEGTTDADAEGDGDESEDEEAPF